MCKQNIIKAVIDSAITLSLVAAVILTSVINVPDDSIIYPILLVCDVIFGIYIIYTDLLPNRIKKRFNIRNNKIP
jgi:hypothetical protein